MANRINRLKVVLAEKGKTGKWLAEELGRDKATVSKWCTNRCQPDINTFLQIAMLLGVDIRDLFNSTESEYKNNFNKYNGNTIQKSRLE